MPEVDGGPRAPGGTARSVRFAPVLCRRAFAPLAGGFRLPSGSGASAYVHFNYTRLIARRWAGGNARGKGPCGKSLQGAIDHETSDKGAKRKITQERGR